MKTLRESISSRRIPVLGRTSVVPPVYRAGDDSVEEGVPEAAVVGGVELATTDTIELAEGELIALVTDGATELPGAELAVTELDEPPMPLHMYWPYAQDGLANSRASIRISGSPTTGLLGAGL